MPHPRNPNPRKIAIPKVRDDRNPVEYRIKLTPKTHDELLLYQQLYRQTYGQDIDARDLLEPIIRRFLENDRGFRRFKKQGGEVLQSKSPDNPRTSR